MAQLRMKYPTASLESTDYWLDLRDFTRGFKDPTGTFTPEVAMRRVFEDTEVVEFGEGTSLEPGAVYWIVFSVSNDIGHDKDFVFDFGPEDYVDLYKLNEKGELESLGRTGCMVPLEQRTMRVPDNRFLIPLSGTERATFLVRLDHRIFHRNPYEVRAATMAGSLSLDAQANLQHGMVIGILAVFAVYHFVLFFSLKDKLYLWYFLLLVSAVWWYISAHGYGLMFFWPGYPEWDKASPLYAVAVALAMWTQFSKRYLDADLSAPGQNLLLNLMMPLFVIPVILIWMNNGGMAQAVMAMVAAGAIGSVLYVAFSSSKMEGSHSSSFLMANSAVLIPGVLILMEYNGWMVSSGYAVSALELGMVMQVALTSLGLGDRLTALRKEKEEALEREVEGKREALEQQKELTEGYARFVPMEFIELIERKSITQVQLGDARQFEMTVLFSDIRSFTSMCEKLTPEGCFAFLNEYLGEMGPLIRNSNGFIDKYIGDAIMALFPESPDDAVHAAVEMQRGLHRVNSKRAARREAPIATGIGIHTGALMLGTLGESERMDSTVISDSVNTASRLEGLCKTYGATIIVSQETMERVKDYSKYAFRFLGAVQLKGKVELTPFLEVYECDELALRGAKEQTKSVFEQGVTAFLHSEFQVAMGCFEQVLAVNGADRPAQLYLADCKQRLNLSA